MPFNLLVTQCFLQGTAFEDTGDSPRISVSPDKTREKIIFFRIDEDGDTNSPFRIAYNMNHDGERICDLIIYYKNLNTGEQYLVLTETKGTDFDRSADQLINTYQKMGLKTCLIRKRYCDNLNVKLCCVSKKINKITLTSAKQAKGKIIEKVKIDKNNCAFVDPFNFIRFLRGEKIPTI